MAKAAATKQAAPPMDSMIRYHPDSRANLIAAMQVGESFPMAERLLFDDATTESLDDAKNRLKGTLGKAAYLAGKRSGFTFVTESGEFFTRSGDIMVVVVVTRTA